MHNTGDRFKVKYVIHIASYYYEGHADPDSRFIGFSENFDIDCFRPINIVIYCFLFTVKKFHVFRGLFRNRETF